MIDAQQVRQILALAPNWLGDAAMCTPALRALANRFPAATITVAARAGICELLEGLPYIQQFSVIPDHASFRDMQRLAAELRPSAKDLAVVFPHSFRAALLAWLCRSRRRLGYARGGRSFLLTDRVSPHRVDGRITPVYTADEYLGSVKPLGCVDDGAGLELHADANCVAEVREWLAGAGPLIGVAPGAAFGPSKRWPAERYAAVMDALADTTGARFVLLTGPGEEDVRETILANTRAPVLDGSGMGVPPMIPRGGISRLKAIVSQIDLLLANDTGPRHVAIAFRKPVVCIMGSTSPVYTHSRWEKGRVLRVDVDCGPCQKPVCTTDHRCMTGIAVEQVAAAVLEFLPNSA